MNMNKLAEISCGPAEILEYYKSSQRHINTALSETWTELKNYTWLDVKRDEIATLLDVVLLCFCSY